MRASHWLRAALAVAVGCAVYGLATVFQGAVLRSTAAVLGVALELLGQENEVRDHLVAGSEVRFLVVAECTAIVPLAILIGGIAATPASLRQRLVAILVGTLALLAWNQLRLVSLWYVERLAPEHFDFVHVALWQPAMVVAVVALWIVWLGRMGIPTLR